MEGSNNIFSTIQGYVEKTYHWNHRQNGGLRRQVEWQTLLIVTLPEIDDILPP